MSARAREYASLRIPKKLRDEVSKMARSERRTLSQMLLILVEEALERRTARFSNKLEAEIAENMGRTA